MNIMKFEVLFFFRKEYNSIKLFKISILIIQEELMLELIMHLTV